MLSMRTLALASAAVLALSAPAFAEQVKYAADLTADQETPATDSTGTGKVDATFDTDTKMLTWTITYDGLTGDVTAAHFHGPAAAGEKAPPVLPIKEPYTSPINGSATLDDQQASDLQAGKWYFNLHTAKYPDGEIRGQMMAADAAGGDAAGGAASTMSSSAAM
jgi:hypothetical protein